MLSMHDEMIYVEQAPALGASGLPDEKKMPNIRCKPSTPRYQQ
jgi:hypothetical protein